MWPRFEARADRATMRPLNRRPKPHHAMPPGGIAPPTPGRAARFVVCRLEFLLSPAVRQCMRRRAIARTSAERLSGLIRGRRRCRRGWPRRRAELGSRPGRALVARGDALAQARASSGCAYGRAYPEAVHFLEDDLGGLLCHLPGISIPRSAAALGPTRRGEARASCRPAASAETISRGSGRLPNPPLARW
jgi:hypothetical protein